MPNVSGVIAGRWWWWVGVFCGGAGGYLEPLSNTAALEHIQTTKASCYVPLGTLSTPLVSNLSSGS